MSDEVLPLGIPRLTAPDDVLLRNVIPQWTNEDETPKSVAFRPTPKDEDHLSTDYGISAADAFASYKKRVGHAPEGTWGLGVGAILECHEEIEVLKDGGTGDLPDSHASIVFPAAGDSKTASRKVHERIARDLKAEAIRRKRQHPPA
ncbi:hypothetical protein [Microbacterium terregens]|uniref:Uncharacterized protein n=1 Tax=Microbacterium terregens TaxID=69363 RepID=A0ABV5SXL6_9MICO